jgi:hypothetical protein
MGNGNMNAELSAYVKKTYPNGKTDLFSVFMDVAIERLADNAKYGMINMHSWMFLGSFEKQRNDIVDSYCIENMLHLGKGTFDELSGEVVQNTAYVVAKTKVIGPAGMLRKGNYFRLVDGRDCSEKERMFLDALTNQTENVCFADVSQACFKEIPGGRIGYWVSDRFRESFSLNNVGAALVTREGMATADNDRFLRLWPEVSKDKFSKLCASADKWYPYNKGGTTRYWYGNREYVVDWANDGAEIRNNKDPKTGRIRSHNYNGEYAFQECLTWSAISSGSLAVRYCEKGFLWDSKGASGFSSGNLTYTIGLLNSKVSDLYLALFSPGMDFKVGDIIQIPFIEERKSAVEKTVAENISISKADWDAHETSWDFQKNELLAMTLEDEDANVQYDIDEAAKRGEMLCVERPAPEPGKLSWRMRVYQGKWERLFNQLHANEEELNRQFIDIYGLQEELTPDVPLDEVTILQQGEISIGKRATCNMSCNAPLVDYSKIEWHEDVVIKQFISYAIGCMLGRYRLDKPGLAIAHPNATAEEVAPYTYNGETFTIDDDGIIPLMNKESAFSDNAVNRFTEFLRIVFGPETLAENLNYVEQCLGKSIEDYLYKNFWDDHKKMYQNRPIYWLFSSKKGAFKCIAYMHRMDRYTAELVRLNYLLPHLNYLKSKIEELEQDESNLSTADRKRLANLRKNLEECLEYEARLQLVASKQIDFDLDDGVVVNYAKFGDVLAKIK